MWLLTSIVLAFCWCFSANRKNFGDNGSPIMLAHADIIFPSKYGMNLCSSSCVLDGTWLADIASGWLLYVSISCGMSMVPISSNAMSHSGWCAQMIRSEVNFSIDSCIAENNANNLFPNPPIGTIVKHFLLWISIFIL